MANDYHNSVLVALKMLKYEDEVIVRGLTSYVLACSIWDAADIAQWKSS